MKRNSGEVSLTNTTEAKILALWNEGVIDQIIELARTVGADDVVPDQVRNTAFTALRGSKKRAAVEGLLELRSHRNTWIRHAALCALGDCKGQEISDALLDSAMNDPQQRLRTLAVVSLCRRPDTSEELLLNLLELGEARVEVVNRLEQRLFRKMSLRGQQHFFQPLLEALKLPDCRIGAAKALGLLGLRDAVPHLQRHRDDPEELVQLAVAEALKRLRK